MHGAFERHLHEMVGRLGGPDLILISGDLAFSGKAEEYEGIDRLLKRIDGIVGRKLPVLAVPGNHDLARPTGMDALRYAGLKHHDEDPVVQRGLWLEKRAAGEAGWLDPLFAEYRAWCERTLKPRALRAGLKLIESERAPGDFRVVVEKKGLRLGVVGLNTAWGQVGDGDFLGKLPLATEQFDALFSDELPARDWFAGLSASILMTHHPRSWL
ncbi:MAG: metallophosphoesterase, partial [Myxococcales bacterium]|nr:metallophosphoesterase [Myxococcales bacterium]